MFFSLRFNSSYVLALWFEATKKGFRFGSRRIRSSLLQWFQLEAGFEQVLLLQNPNVLDVGDIIDTYVYRVGLEQRKYSYSAAVGVFKSIINLILILSTNYTTKKMGQESLF